MRDSVPCLLHLTAPAWGYKLSYALRNPGRVLALTPGAAAGTR